MKGNLVQALDTLMRMPLCCDQVGLVYGNLHG